MGGTGVGLMLIIEGPERGAHVKKAGYLSGSSLVQKYSSAWWGCFREHPKSQVSPDPRVLGRWVRGVRFLLQLSLIFLAEPFQQRSI